MLLLSALMAGTAVVHANREVTNVASAHSRGVDGVMKALQEVGMDISKPTPIYGTVSPEYMDRAHEALKQYAYSEAPDRDVEFARNVESLVKQEMAELGDKEKVATVTALELALDSQQYWQAHFKSAGIAVAQADLLEIILADVTAFVKSMGEGDSIWVALVKAISASLIKWLQG